MIKVIILDFRRFFSAFIYTARSSVYEIFYPCDNAKEKKPYQTVTYLCDLFFDAIKTILSTRSFISALKNRKCSKLMVFKINVGMQNLSEYEQEIP